MGLGRRGLVVYIVAAGFMFVPHFPLLACSRLNLCSPTHVVNPSSSGVHSHPQPHISCQVVQSRATGHRQDKFATNMKAANVTRHDARCARGPIRGLRPLVRSRWQ